MSLIHSGAARMPLARAGPAALARSASIQRLHRSGASTRVGTTINAVTPSAIPRLRHSRRKANHSSPMPVVTLVSKIDGPHPGPAEAQDHSDAEQGVDVAQRDLESDRVREDHGKGEWPGHDRDGRGLQQRPGVGEHRPRQQAEQAEGHHDGRGVEQGVRAALRQPGRPSPGWPPSRRGRRTRTGPTRPRLRTRAPPPHRRPRRPGSASGWTALASWSVPEPRPEEHRRPEQAPPVPDPVHLGVALSVVSDGHRVLDQLDTGLWMTLYSRYGSRS